MKLSTKLKNFPEADLATIGTLEAFKVALNPLQIFVFNFLQDIYLSLLVAFQR